MIKILGVITEGGLLIKMIRSREVERENVLSSLTSAAKGISEVMGQDEIKKVEFGTDLLLLADCKKKYTVLALTDSAEEYVERLLEVIATKIDETNAIPPSPRSIKESLVTTVKEIMKTYVSKKLDINLSATLKELWNPILHEAKKDQELAKRIDDLDEKLGGTPKIDEKEWHNFKSKVEGEQKKAIEYALEGNFDYACAASLETPDPLFKMFAIKMGLLSSSMIGMHAPPLHELAGMVEELPKTDPYTKLLRSKIELTREHIPRPEYLHVFGETMTEHFEFGDNKKHLLLSFLFLDEVLSSFPDFANKLANFFKNKSEVIHTFISAIIERQEIFSQIYSITKRAELGEALDKWSVRSKQVTNELDKVLKPGFLKRFFRISPRGAEANKIIFKSLTELTGCIVLLTALCESPALNLIERRKTLEKVLDIFNYFKRAYEKKLPMSHTALHSALQDLVVAKAELYSMYTQKEKTKHAEELRTILKDLINITVKHGDVSTSTWSNYLCATLSMSNLRYEEEILLVYAILQRENFHQVQSRKQVDQYNFFVESHNLLSTLSALALKFLEGKKKDRVLRKCVDRLVNVTKWGLFLGRINRDDLLSLIYYVSQTVDVFPKNKLKKLVNTIIGFSKIAVPDWKEKDYDLAILSDPLIDLLIKSSKKLSKNVFIQLAQDIYEIAVNAWRKYGFQEKAQELEEKYESLFSTL